MKIVIADDLDEIARRKFEKLGDLVYKPTNLHLAVQDADVLVVRSTTKVDERVLDAAKRLKVVARAGVGLDNIDVLACERGGVKGIDAAGATTSSVAELTIGLIILMLRKVLTARDFAKQKIWKRNELIGNELRGKTLGIVGLGRIGSEVARIAKSMNIKVIAYDPYVKDSENARLVTLDELLRNSDVVSIHAMLTSQTVGMINSESIGKMKDGVYLVNTSRGALIDEEALYAALKSGKIKAAALDVLAQQPYDGKLLECDNVIITSHIGANTAEAQERISDELINKLKIILK